MDVLSFHLERDDLCERFGGGLTRGSLFVIEGAEGTGKSVLAQRLATGLVHNGHSVSYVSTELTTAAFLGQMRSLDYAVEKEMLAEQLVFIPVHPVLGLRAPRQDLLKRIVKAKAMYTKDVIIFDSFSKFLADHARSAGKDFESMEQMEMVLHHFKRLTAAGKTIILNFETNQCDESAARIFKDTADALLSLKFELFGNMATRRIIVNRMIRAAGRFGDVVGYRVEPGVGIVIEIRSVV